METKQNSENQEKAGKTRKIVTALVVIVVLAALVLAAQYLVSNVDIVEMLRKMHGG
jgi:flagellar basal body-associated protein FliL